jgi:simple sugar transport system ATP-binding protein
MAELGRTVIFISHKLHEVKAVADRVTVLRGGRTIATLSTEDATPRSLASLMVGREMTEGARVGKQRQPAETILETSGLCADGDRGGAALKDVSLVARAGEIVAIAGVAGNGQLELAETIAGVRAPTAGRVLVERRVVRPGDPRAAFAAGVAYVPEDRLGTGLAPSLSIASNLALKSYRGAPSSRGPLLRLRVIRDRAVELIRRYRIAAPGPHAQARQLSGGNLQKVVLAREFTAEPRLIVAAAPTRGLDVGAIETVHAYLRDAAAGGAAVLMISEDLDEILLLADRIAVMYEGAILGEFDADDADVEEIGLLMAGGHDPHQD